MKTILIAIVLFPSFALADTCKIFYSGLDGTVVSWIRESGYVTLLRSDQFADFSLETRIERTWNIFGREGKAYYLILTSKKTGDQQKVKYLKCFQGPSAECPGGSDGNKMRKNLRKLLKGLSCE